MLKKRIIITGGGTGGHIFPGIAIARELSKHPEVDVLYVGMNGGRESKWVPDDGFSFEGIQTSSFPRRLSVKWVTFWFEFAKSLIQADKILNRYHPDAVFATGGYVSVPVALVASFRGIPVGLFEPNVVPGLAAKLLSLFSRRIFVGFEDTLKHFSKGRAQWTGIPVREEIMKAEKTKSKVSFGLNLDLPTILMLGGSQGAHSLNQFMTDVIKFLDEGGQSLQIIMMTGWDDYRKTVDALEKCTLKVVLRPFISNIHEAYAAADLIIARSGAMTCAEILSRGLPALFIPYPHASGHQEMNARALEKAGSAVVIIEKDLDEEKLTRTLISLLLDKKKLMEMGENEGALTKLQASNHIVEELLKMAEKRKAA